MSFVKTDRQSQSDRIKKKTKTRVLEMSLAQQEKMCTRRVRPKGFTHDSGRWGWGLMKEERKRGATHAVIG